MATTITAGNATNGAAISSDSTGILELKSGTGSGTTAVTLNASQNVGIGTTNPSVRLHIAGASQLVRLQNDNAYIQFANTANSIDTAYIQQTASVFNIVSQVNGPMVFGTNSAERMRLDASGNLGIGTTSPGYTTSGRVVLQVNGATSSLIGLAYGGVNAGYIFASASSTTVFSEGSRALELAVAGAAPVTFFTNNIERARITSDGYFLLGATALTSNGFFTNAGTSAALTSVSGTNVRAWTQTYSASASNNATVDAWLGLDAAGNIFGNGPMIGHFFVNVVGASGANQFSGVYSIVTTSNGTTNATLAAVSTVTRGTSPVASIQIANNGANGAIKLTITYINNSGVVTGGASRVTFIGQIA